MANVSEIDIMTPSNYYDPKEDKSPQRLVAGKYKGHITQVQVNKRDIGGGKYMAKIFNFETELIDEGFKGRKVWSTGIFYFLAPSNGDTFQANPGGNGRYLSLAKAVGIDCKEVEINVNGEKRMVSQLPDLTEDDLLHKGVNVVVDFEKPWKNTEGETVKRLRVKSVTTWEDAPVYDVDIPF